MYYAAYIANLEALLAAVEAQPENLFDLGSWKMETSCGTNFCVAGLACMMPRFQALGMEWSGNGVPLVSGVSVWQGGGDALFGENSMYELFHASGSGQLDTELGLVFTVEEDDGYTDIHMDCTDKELAIARLKHRIASYKEKL